MVLISLLLTSKLRYFHFVNNFLFALLNTLAGATFSVKSDVYSSDMHVVVGDHQHQLRGTTLFATTART
jgi:hypothetical protein